MRFHGHSGLTPQETEIMDLWDNGCGMAAIARQCAVSRSRVERTVSTYHDSESKRIRIALQTGSVRLLAALQQAAAATAGQK